MGGKIITITGSFLLSRTPTGCVFHALLFSSSSPSFFCFGPLLSPVWKYTGNICHNGTFHTSFAQWGFECSGERYSRGDRIVVHHHVSKTLSQIRPLTGASLRSAGSDGAQASLHFATLKLLHGRPAITALTNGWTESYWPPLRRWCIGCLVVGGWREASKAVSYLQEEVECRWEVRGKAFGGLVHHCDRVKTAVSHYFPLEIPFYIIMRSRHILSTLWVAECREKQTHGEHSTCCPLLLFDHVLLCRLPIFDSIFFLALISCISLVFFPWYNTDVFPLPYININSETTNGLMF